MASLLVLQELTGQLKTPLPPEAPKDVSHDTTKWRMDETE